MRKLITLLLCAVMMFNLGISVFASQETEYETITGEYKYSNSLDMLSKADQVYKFTYSDEYFTHSGYEYNHELAIMTMDMAQSSGASVDGDWSIANKNFYDLMGKCGFTDIDSNYYANHHPTSDSVGVNMASKKIVDNGKTYTLVAIGIRGHGYKCEWGSNFNIGASGDHAGFAKGCEQVLDYMKSYFEKYDIKGDVKIWLTGYSRSAIIANMVGGVLDGGFNLGKGASFDLDDLYCYTFEAPQGTSDDACRDAVYWNIHNIINPNDLVTVVSFAEWGHSRYGIDYCLPCRQYDGSYYYSLKPQVDTILDGMGWMNIAGITFDIIDDFHYLSFKPSTAICKQNISQIEFYQELIPVLIETLAPTREYYVENFQADLRELFTTLFNTGDGVLNDVFVIFAEKLIKTDNIKALAYSMTLKGAVAEGPVIDVAADLFMEAMQEAGCASYNGDQVREMIKKLTPKLIGMFVKHPDTVLTLLGNVLQILNAHCPEVGRAWLEVTPAEFFEAQSPRLFSDVSPDSYYYEAVRWAYSKGIVKGFTPDSFAPNASCTRAQVVAFLWRAAGSPEPSSDKCAFVDVDPSNPYYKAIIWAVDKHITLGVDKTHFEPDAQCSRSQIATFLYRYAGSPRVSAKCPFVDVDSSDPAIKAITWAAKEGITLGVDETHFAPDSLCTRAQVVTMLYRALT